MFGGDRLAQAINKIHSFCHV